MGRHDVNAEGAPAFAVIAHRGASGQAPENTLAALRRAADLGAGWAEVDVQRTADGVLVLVHDDTWERTAGVAAGVAATPWTVVRGFDAGRWFAPRFAGECVPALADVFTAVGHRLRLDLEIKSPAQHPGLAADVVAAVRRAGLQSRVVLSCFDPVVVEWVADQAPDIAAAYLVQSPSSARHPRVAIFVLDHALVTGDPAFVAALRSDGRRIWSYTVDEVALAGVVAAAGVEAVITNYPERFLAGRAAT